MTGLDFAPFTAILDREEAAGRPVTFWWRDDDAVGPSPALDRLLSLAGSVGAGVAIAAIPAHAAASLGEALAGHADARILVHGRTHLNHAPPGEKKAEFGRHRPRNAMEGEAEQALASIRISFGPRALPVFVPPWNRIDPSLARRLGSLGYTGLSTFGSHAFDAGGLQVVNAHLDPVDWRGSRGAVAPRALAGALDRAVSEGGGCRVGLLTHHLVFTEELWTSVAALLDAIARHPAGRFVTPDSIWAPKRH